MCIQRSNFKGVTVGFPSENRGDTLSTRLSGPLSQSDQPFDVTSEKMVENEQIESNTGGALSPNSRTGKR